MASPDQDKTAKLNLSAKERAFIAEYFRNGFNATAAYLTIRPDAPESSARSESSRLLSRIKAKSAWEQILELGGLDDMRLVQEVNARLNAKTAEFFKGRQVAVLEDNATRMRATELLADLRGRRKSEIGLNLNQDEGLVVILNGGAGAADSSPKAV